MGLESVARVPGRIGEAIEECGALLQVALDTDSLWEAFRISSLMPGDRRVVLEAGTPLIKSVGLQDSIGVLRGVAGQDRAVVADTKTVDAGRLEAKSAGEAGADAITVISEAHEATIKEALEASEAYGMAVYVDLMLSRNPLESAERALGLGSHIILLHIGVDAQKALGLTAYELRGLVKRLSDEGAIVAVAGGITPGEAGALVDSGAAIVIIGGAITRAGDPRSAALKALQSLDKAGARCK